MRRPRGFAILVVLLVLLAVAGGLNAWWAITANPFDLPYPELAAITDAVYGVLALATGFALWTLARWALAGYAAWAATGIAVLWLSQPGPNFFAGLAATPAAQRWWSAAPVMLILLAAGGWYIWNTLRRAAPTPSA